MGNVVQPISNSSADDLVEDEFVCTQPIRVMPVPIYAVQTIAIDMICSGSAQQEEFQNHWGLQLAVQPDSASEESER